MRVCVLGHRGMLGHVVARYLRERGHDVAIITRKFSAEDPDSFIEEIFATRSAWCINCIGARPGPAMTRGQLFEINAMLPGLCASALKGTSHFLHASSDGVFRPDRENRSVGETLDATDDYGLSKLQGETATLEMGGSVVRCSIIGPELGEPRSLFGWLMQQPEANGFVNHFWNGITTLEWAKVCDESIKSSPGKPEILQPGTLPPVSKCELLRLIARIWGLKTKITPMTANPPVHRTLVPDPLRSGLEQQLRELKDWYSDNGLVQTG